MRSIRSLSVFALAMTFILTAPGVMAKGKPAHAGNTTAASSCLAQGSTLTLKNAAGTMTVTVSFRSQAACTRFLAHNPGMSVQSVTPGFTSVGLQPTSMHRVFGNSSAAQFCPASGTTAQVSFRTLSGTTTGMANFPNPLKSHGQCVSYFARNKSLLIVH
ncbi:MAG TPA: hypothetical protein VF221_05270 [Chloroflexota bacterium]